MISVSRKTHMPKVEASFCCSISSKWCTSAGWCGCSAVVVWLSNNGVLLIGSVMVRLFGDYRGFMEIVRGRRRSSLPLQPGGAPRIVAGDGAIFQGPGQVNRRQDESHRQDGCSGAGEHVEHLELRRVHGIAPRHAEISQNELGEE